ncbi:MAG: DUF169 domain-containing protein [Ignavibacteria bacterium]|nr:DUF169 domain-containing protein [Ignavibacteria bacterium]
MELKIKNDFLEKWERYFGKSELPITFYFSNDLKDTKPALKPGAGHSCLICELKKVREGESVAYTEDTISCRGARRYTGFTNEIFPDFRYFLSCGIPDKLEGERYKQSPELVDDFLINYTPLPTEKKYLVFKRWDKLSEQDEPVAVIFFAKPDVLSGLFSLANYDSGEPYGVTAPFAAGCGSIIHYPALENLKDDPKCIFGMFDPSARHCVEPDELTFSIPFKRFTRIIGYMNESFLITDTWKKVESRIKK